MGRVRVERISLRDERSHSEGISLASERSAPRAHDSTARFSTLGKISLTLTKICFAEATRKKARTHVGVFELFNRDQSEFGSKRSKENERERGGEREKEKERKMRA